MHGAIFLFFTFILSYLFKLRFLGREDFTEWSSTDINVLRTHETFVLILFLAGLVARLLARKLDPAPSDLTKVQRRVVARRHRLAGRIAVISGILALLTAGMVLAGMYQRTMAASRSVAVHSVVHGADNPMTVTIDPTTVIMRNRDHEKP